jgi:hypothetical protein
MNRMSSLLFRIEVADQTEERGRPPLYPLVPDGFSSLNARRLLARQRWSASSAMTAAWHRPLPPDAEDRRRDYFCRNCKGVCARSIEPALFFSSDLSRSPIGHLEQTSSKMLSQKKPFSNASDSDAGSSSATSSTIATIRPSEPLCVRSMAVRARIFGDSLEAYLHFDAKQGISILIAIP